MGCEIFEERHMAFIEVPLRIYSRKANQAFILILLDENKVFVNLLKVFRHSLHLYLLIPFLS